MQFPQYGNLITAGLFVYNFHTFSRDFRSIYSFFFSQISSFYTLYNVVTSEHQIL